jgi:hypothetical protein
MPIHAQSGQVLIREKIPRSFHCSVALRMPGRIENAPRARGQCYQRLSLAHCGGGWFFQKDMLARAQRMQERLLLREAHWSASRATVPAPPTAATKNTPNELWSAPELPGPVSAPQSIAQISPLATTKSVADIVVATKSIAEYEDISSRAAYAKSAMYLKSKAVPVLQNESVFRPLQAMTRREAVLYLA